MTFIIQDMLDYGQIKSGKFRKKFTTFNVRELIREVISIQKRQADEKNIDLYATFKSISDDEEAAPLLLHSPLLICDK